MDHFAGQLNGYCNYSSVYNFVIPHLPTDGKMVEVGVLFGQGVCYAAVEIINHEKNVNITAVDTWTGTPDNTTIMTLYNDNDVYNQFLTNITPVQDHITVVKLDSVSAAATFADGSVDFVYLDADTNHDAVKASIDAWLPKVKSGGFIGGHNYDLDTVKQAVIEVFPEGTPNFLTYNGTGWGDSWLVTKA